MVQDQNLNPINRNACLDPVNASVTLPFLTAVAAVIIYSYWEKPPLHGPAI